MNSSLSSNQRDAFEAWAKSRHWTILRNPHNRDVYQSGETQMGWWAWQAAIATHEPCAIHATEHRVRDTLPCPWCVIDELKRNRDSAIPPPAVTGEAIDAARAALKSDTNVTYPSHVAARQVRHVIRELVSAYERLHTLYTATCATYCHEHERASPPPPADRSFERVAIRDDKTWPFSPIWKIGGVQFVEFDIAIEAIRKAARAPREPSPPTGCQECEDLRARLYQSLVLRGYAQHEAHAEVWGPPLTKSGVPGSQPIGEYMAELRKDPEWKAEFAAADKAPCMHPNMEELRKCPECRQAWWPAGETRDSRERTSLEIDDDHDLDAWHSDR